MYSPLNQDENNDITIIYFENRNINKKNNFCLLFLKNTCSLLIFIFLVLAIIIVGIYFSKLNLNYEYKITKIFGYKIIYDIKYNKYNPSLMLKIDDINNCELDVCDIEIYNPPLECLETYNKHSYDCALECINFYNKTENENLGIYVVDNNKCTRSVLLKYLYELSIIIFIILLLIIIVSLLCCLIFKT